MGSGVILSHSSGLFHSGLTMFCCSANYLTNNFFILASSAGDTSAE